MMKHVNLIMVFSDIFLEYLCLALKKFGKKTHNTHKHSHKQNILDP